MRIVIDLYHDHVVNALCVAARDDEELLNDKPNKTRIKEIVTEVIRSRGMDFDGWNDDLSEYTSATINGWAVAQANRYTW
jgi:hypothetical protein